MEIGIFAILMLLAVVLAIVFGIPVAFCNGGIFPYICPDVSG